MRSAGGQSVRGKARQQKQSLCSKKQPLRPSIGGNLLGALLSSLRDPPARFFGAADRSRTCHLLSGTEKARREAALP